MLDYLPMWEMYGDHARGCCLVIDWETSKWMEEEAEPVLYHVCYLRKQGNSYVVLNEDNEKLSRSCRAINSQLQELHNVAEEIAEQDRRYLLFLRRTLTASRSRGIHAARNVPCF